MTTSSEAGISAALHRLLITDPDEAAVALMKAIVASDPEWARTAIAGLSRDDVYSLKHHAEEMLGFVDERFREMPEE